MIIIRIKGGIGNQMFHYAFARSISIAKNTEFKLDISSYNQNLLRTYRLNFFNIVEDLADSKISKRLRYPYGMLSKCTNKLKFLFMLHSLRFFYALRKYRIFSKVEEIIKPGIVKINCTNWDPLGEDDGRLWIQQIINCKKDRYFEGHWTSFKYFEDIRDILLKDFKLKTPLEKKYPNLVSLATEHNSVSISVRRTDYLHRKNIKFYGIISVNYYKKAIEYLTQRTKNPFFFIFSDDPQWVKDNIPINYPISFISDGKLKDYEELILISKCKHNIITNSTFSWWGAWLNTNPDKIVIVPTPWHNKLLPATIDNIAPSDWIRIPKYDR